MYANREFVQAGGFMSYGPNFHDLYRRAAEFVDKILRGAKPSDIPVEQPTKFELIINLVAAKAIGIAFPPSLIALADEVIGVASRSGRAAGRPREAHRPSRRS